MTTPALRRASAATALRVTLAFACLVGFSNPSGLYAQQPSPYPPGQPPRRPPIQTIVYPDTTDWFPYTPGDSSVAITAVNPRSGRGSLELTKGNGNGSAFINESRTFGTVGMLSSFSFDWFTDPASSSSLPPDIALRVYSYGDPRSFFLVWNGCSATSCGTYPTGTWQRSDIVRSLSIQQAEDNPPPARLVDVPRDAPIIGIHVPTSYSFGGPWHGFVDNVTLGFAGQRPTSYNFEPTSTLNTASLLLTNAHIDPTENNQVVRAFVPTGSKSTNCVATLNEMANSAYPFGIVLFCGEREPAGVGGVPGVLVSVFFPQPVSPAGFVLSLTLYQQGAGTYGPPVLCTSAEGC